MVCEACSCRRTRPISICLPAISSSSFWVSFKRSMSAGSERLNSVFIPSLRIFCIFSRSSRVPSKPPAEMVLAFARASEKDMKPACASLSPRLSFSMASSACLMAAASVFVRRVFLYSSRRLMAFWVSSMVLSKLPAFTSAMVCEACSCRRTRSISMCFLTMSSNNPWVSLRREMSFGSDRLSFVAIPSLRIF